MLVASDDLPTDIARHRVAVWAYHLIALTKWDQTHQCEAACMLGKMYIRRVPSRKLLIHHENYIRSEYTGEAAKANLSDTWDSSS